jgi:RNA polymerase sigma factor (sigma-70 family)
VKNGLNDAMAHLRRMMLAHHQASDGELLGRFIRHRDEEAFEALVRRHGKMVLGVCCRLLHNPQDAEDAFQSVFLVLVLKAASIVPREMVGNWLYGVARQTAVRVKSMNAKRRRREAQVAALPESASASQESRNDLLDFLDQELGSLPEKYRVVIVLRDLEGRTHKQVAKQLGCPEGTVSARLARGRAMLAKRLARRGLLSSEAVAVCLSQNAATAALPPSLVSATVHASFLFALGQKASIPAKVSAITQGVLSAMLVTKLRMVVAVAVMACVLGLGLGSRFLSGPTAEGAQPENAKRGAGPTTAAGGKLANVKEGAGPDANRRSPRGKDASPWEYKVVIFGIVGEKDATKQLNDLAADGWHYVGLLGTATQPNLGGGLGAPAFSGAVVFRKGKDSQASGSGQKTPQ